MMEVREVHGTGGLAMTNDTDRAKIVDKMRRNAGWRDTGSRCITAPTMLIEAAGLIEQDGATIEALRVDLAAAEAKVAKLVEALRKITFYDTEDHPERGDDICEHYFPLKEIASAALKEISG